MIWVSWRHGSCDKEDLRYKQKIMRYIETSQTHCVGHMALNWGMIGIEEGFDPYMLDVSWMVKESWDIVNDSTIERFCVKENNFIAGKKVETTCLYGKMHKHFNDESVAEIIAIRPKLSMNLHSQDPLYYKLVRLRLLQKLTDGFVWKRLTGLLSKHELTKELMK